MASITSSTTRVEFIEGTSKREDLDASPYNSSLITDNLSRPDYQCYPLAQIKISGIGGSPYCKSFHFNYDYFKAFESPLYSFDVRLKLNSVQEITCNGTGESVNPYIFDYYTKSNINYDFLPWRLTKAKDGYGYYNGEDSYNNQKKLNIPPTTLSVSHESFVVTEAFGAARRYTSFTPMQYGTLKSVRYPEQGQNEFIYEANSIKQVTYDTTEVSLKGIKPTLTNCNLDANSSTLCCGTQDTSRVYNFDQAFIDSAIIRIYLQNVGCMSEPGVPYEGFVRLVVRDMVTGNTIGTLKEGNSTKLLDSISIDMQAAYPNMIAGRDYRFEMEVTECRAFLFFKKKRILATASNALVGGLRLKEQHSYDRSNTLLTSRFYDYNRPEEPNISSGVVYKKPVFGQVISGDDITAVNSSGSQITNFFAKLSWNSTPIVNLSDLQGYHIGYRTVREYQSNGAFTDYIFQTRSLDSELGNTLLPYPVAPLPYFFDNGKIKRQQQGGGGNGGAEFIVQHQGFHAGTLLETITQNQAIRVEGQSGMAGILLLTNRFSWQNSGFYEAFRDTSIIDGVQTIQVYDYASFPRDHLQPTSVTMLNSDGEATVNKTRFPHEIKADGDLANQAVYQEMIDRNMIGIPIEQSRTVDGTLVSGMRNQFNIFFGDPYLDSVFTYETTWDSMDVEVQTGWELLGNIEEYYDFGKPKKIKRKHWQVMELQYHPVHRLISERSFLNYRWNYEYHPGSRLIAKITDIDRQEIDFDYDGLGRLKTIEERMGAVKTDFTYKYAGQDPNRPQTYIQQQLTYTPVNGSALQQQTIWRYFDDLSRPIQTVKQAYSAENSMDVVSATAYDAFSRPFKQYEAFESNNADGQLVAVPNNTPFTITTYEETPLNRPMSSTPPDWYSTQFEYGHNTAADAVKNWKDNSVYTAGLLTKEVVIDPNQHRTILFKDKRGRAVLSRKEGLTNADRADTYTLYDAKERPSVIIPPDATLTTTPNLIFKTYYDGADNPILKKLPDMEILELFYNDRDLMVAKRGGNLRTDGKWMITAYDDHGRATQTGLITKTGPPNPNTISPTAVWTNNYYDGNTSAAIFSELGITTGDMPSNLNPDISIGKLTAQERFVLNGNSLTGDKVLRVMAYNDYGQMSRELGSNHYASSRLWKYFEYDFADNLIQQRRWFHTTDIFLDHRDTLNNSYDHQGRLLDTYHAMEDKDRQHLSRLEYTAKDEVKTRYLGGTLSGFLQEVNYEYLNNGFLLGINPTMSATDLFKLDINYDQAIAGLSGTAQKNGNITSLTWQVKDKMSETYGYHYDFLDRLTAANYNGNSNAYGTSYSYDLRGNISNLTRRGVYSDGTNFLPQQIDNLTFTPIAGTNKIQKITDTAPCPANKVIHKALDNSQVHAVGSLLEADNEVNSGAAITYQAGTSVSLMSGFHAKAGTDFTAQIGTCPQSGYETDGFVQRSSADIEYDVEGNRIKDPNKGIDISYNYLNQPYKVIWTNGNSIEWLYDGSGNKLQQVNKRSTVEIDKIDYLDGEIEYESDTLSKIYLGDARANFEQGILAGYIYYLKDHLMSTRVVFEEDGNGQATQLSEHHSYPFGMQMEGDFTRAASIKRLYNFKETVNDFDLGWSDFGFRWYLGGGGEPVFLTVDPVSERFPHVSGYNYAENRVPNGLDLHGLQFISANQAKINISAGGISLKTKNLSNPTKAQIALAKPVTGRDNSGTFITTTFPTTLSSVNFRGNSPKRSRATSSNANIVTEVTNDKPSGNSRQRRRQRRATRGLPKGASFTTPANIPTGNGAGGKGLGVLWAFAEFSSWLTNEAIENDIESAQWQSDVLADLALNIVSDAFNNEKFDFPEIEGFSTKQIYTDLANYIFQGEFLNQYNEKDLQRMTEVARNLILVNGIELRSEE